MTKKSETQSVNGRAAEYHYFTFADHSTLYGGLLPNMKEAYACWFYCRLAMKNLSQTQRGAWREGDDDHINQFNNIARSVATVYQLESPEDFLKFMPLCEMEAMRVGFSWHPSIMTPSKHMWNRKH